MQEEAEEEGCESTGFGGVRGELGGEVLLLRLREAGHRGEVGSEFRGLGRMERFEVMIIIVRMILRKQQILSHLRKV